jgi:hypothetical protein
MTNCLQSEIGMGPVGARGRRDDKRSGGYALARTLLTVIACQRLPRAVGTPRAFSASAMARSDLAPAFCISRMIGSTLAACRSALAATTSTATLRAWAMLRASRLHTASLDALESVAGACRTHRALLLCQRREQVQDERVNVSAQLGHDELHPLGHQAADKMDIAAEAVQLGDDHRAPATAGVLERGGELRAAVEGVRALACLDLDELAGDVEALGGSKARDGLALRVEPRRAKHTVEAANSCNTC